MNDPLWDDFRRAEAQGTVRKLWGTASGNSPFPLFSKEGDRGGVSERSCCNFMRILLRDHNAIRIGEYLILIHYCPNCGRELIKENNG